MRCTMPSSTASPMPAICATMSSGRRRTARVPNRISCAAPWEGAITAGARTINIPDTVGYAVPEEFAARIAMLMDRVPNIDKAVISVHCHNDLGLAVANSLAAVVAGARQIECTINGIGERAGNCALEEVVMALRTRHDAMPFTTGIDATLITRASHLVSTITGFTVQPNKAIVGANAFCPTRRASTRTACSRTPRPTRS